MTAKASGAFCARVAAAKAKIEAAKERDKIDAQLAALPVPTAGRRRPDAEAPVADAYVANVMALLNEAGLQAVRAAGQGRGGLSRALGFELLAALGPTCWLAFINMMALGGAYASAAAARVRKAVAKPDYPSSE